MKHTKSGPSLLADLRAKYHEKFKSDEPQYRSFHDLLWQIAINGMLDAEEHPVIFHAHVGNEHNELVLTYYTGGYKTTGVYFKSDDYNLCWALATDINKLFFEVPEKDQIGIISKSMQLS